MIRQKGFTIIEYMVAILIGLILLAGFSYVFLGMKQSFNTQGGVSQLQENGRFALYFMTNEIQSAGFVQVNDDTDVTEAIIPHVIEGAGSTSDGGDISTSDEIEVTYEADTDCLGNPAPASGIINNHFYVDNGQLMCEGIAGRPQPLIDGVEAMHFIYGVDTDSDTDGVPNKFVKASALASDEYARISSVKVILLLASNDNVHSTDTAQKFNVVGESGTLDVSDKKIRKLFTTTISLPNQPDF